MKIQSNLSTLGIVSLNAERARVALAKRESTGIQVPNSQVMAVTDSVQSWVDHLSPQAGWTKDTLVDDAIADLEALRRASRTEGIVRFAALPAAAAAVGLGARSLAGPVTKALPWLTSANGAGPWVAMAAAVSVTAAIGHFCWGKGAQALEESRVYGQLQNDLSRLA